VADFFGGSVKEFFNGTLMVVWLDVNKNCRILVAFLCGMAGTRTIS